MALTKVTYSMIEGAVVNVLDYGADKTGSTNSQSAIQSAVDAINTAGGGTVYLPNGTYKIESPITIYSNVRFIGESRESTTIVKTTNTPVAANATTPLVCLYNAAMGDANGDVNCILWVYDAIRAEKVEIAHLTLKSNGTAATTSLVDHGIATVGMSDSYIHEIDIQYLKGAAFVSPVIFFSKIEIVEMFKCVYGISIENGTSLTIANNYALYCQYHGYYLRDIKYSAVYSNACDGLNNVTNSPDYTNRAVYATCYRIDACYSVKIENNGAEDCFSNFVILDSCVNVSFENNLMISPQSSYTGGSQIALFYIRTLSRNVTIKNNFIFRNNVTALQGSANPAQHSDVYVNVSSENIGFVFENNWLSNLKYDAPSAIYGNIIPSYIATGTQGAQLFGQFTPTISLVNATGVSITYGANNYGRYSIVNGWMYVEAYIDIASVTFTGTTNIYPQIGGLPIANKSAQSCDLLITESANVTWPSTEPFYFCIDTTQKTGLAKNRTRTVTLGAGATPSFVTGSTNVVLKCSGQVYVGDLTNIV